MARRIESHEGAILGEIADLLIQIRDRLPEKPPPAADGSVVLQEPATPAKRGPGRPRKNVGG